MGGRESAGALFGKEKLVLLIETEQGEIFGAYIESPINTYIDEKEKQFSSLSALTFKAVFLRLLAAIGKKVAE